MRWLLAAALAFVALPASAQVRRIAVVGVSLDKAAPADGEVGAHAVAQYVQSDHRFEWVPPGAALRDSGPAQEAHALEARRLFGEAREALDNLDLPRAATTIDRALKFYEGSDLALGIQGYVDALALRALIAQARQDKSGFNNDAQRVLAVAPDYAWDSARLTPATSAALEALRKKARAVAPVQLSLTSTPGGAWAYVDGVFRGVTPTQVSGLAAGSHIVTLVASGYELLQEKVFAGSGTAPTFSLKPSAHGKDALSQIAQVRAALERDDLGKAAGGLARVEQADEVLVAVVASHKGTLAARVVRVLSDGTEVATAERPFAQEATDWPAMAKEVLAKEIAAPKAMDSTPRAVVTEVETDHSGRRPWGWIAAGGSAVALAAGIAFGSASQSRAAEANATPQLDAATYSRLASAAKVDAHLADAMFGATLLAAGASVYLLITGYSSSGAEEEEGLLIRPSSGGASVGVWGRF